MFMFYAHVPYTPLRNSHIFIFASLTYCLHSPHISSLSLSPATGNPHISCCFPLQGIVTFALSLVDSLLFVHYVAIIILEIRQLQPQFAIKVVRSPDGQSQVFSVGLLSIQRAAVHILEQYYTHFEVRLSSLL